MKVAPSLLAADFACLSKELQRVESADWIHFDVMDGHFVPNLSFGPLVLQSLKQHTQLFVDVHLMVTNPIHYIQPFVDAGAQLIVFHFEACKSPEQIKNLISQIHQMGIWAGISIKPQTDVMVLDPYLEDLDVVLIMSVEPGRGGQSFMPSSLDKIAQLKAMILAKNSKCLIEVDGGINPETAKMCQAAGADVVVAGSSIFQATDYKQVIKDLR